MSGLLEVLFRLAVTGWAALLAVLGPRVATAQHIAIAGRAAAACCGRHTVGDGPIGKLQVRG